MSSFQSASDIQINATYFPLFSKLLTSKNTPDYALKSAELLSLVAQECNYSAGTTPLVSFTKQELMSFLQTNEIVLASILHLLKKQEYMTSRPEGTLHDQDVVSLGLLPALARDLNAMSTSQAAS